SACGMPLPGGGGVHVAPSSVLLYTPPLAVPARIVPVGPVSTACTDALRFLGCAGSTSGPCATGAKLALPLERKSPPSVPAYTCPPAKKMARTLRELLGNAPNGPHERPSSVERYTPSPSVAA